MSVVALTSQTHTQRPQPVWTSFRYWVGLVWSRPSYEETTASDLAVICLQPGLCFLCLHKLAQRVPAASSILSSLDSRAREHICHCLWWHG